jgi:membrane-associated phospholipid phosphatase
MEQNTSVMPAALHPRGPHRPRLEATAPVPILEARQGGIAEWLESVVYRGYPFAASYVISNLLSFVVIGIAILSGWFVTRTLLPMGGLERLDERSPEWFATHRTPFWNDVTNYTSQVGATVLIVAVLVTSLVFAYRRRWRVAGFLLTAIVVEVTTYRVIAGVVGRERPDVHRLDHLNPNHSFPSGHTAASIAVYGGFTLLLTSRFHNKWLRISLWTIALAIVSAVGASRLYRGDHHPSDLIAGAILGSGALLVAVLATRAGIVASERRPPWDPDGDRE